MCVDAYHLGQSNAVTSGLTGPGMVCLPRRQVPASLTATMASDFRAQLPNMQNPGDIICIAVQPEALQ